MASLSTVYVRAKRERATYFLEAQKSDRVDVLRRTLAAILEREPEQIRLRNMDKTELNLNRTLEEARLEDGSAVRFDYLLPDGTWENAEIEAPPAFVPGAGDDDDEDTETARRSTETMAVEGRP